MYKVEFSKHPLSLSLSIVLLGLRARACARPKHVAGGRKAGLVGIRREGLEERGWCGGRPCWMLDCAGEGWGECVGWAQPRGFMMDMWVGLG